ncbi:MAG TPA: alanine racemase [Candidatus Dormibacteraeota bacterium]|nr:alanine racemase [Candidatus Dormibacteraeota bacterium]
MTADLLAELADAYGTPLYVYALDRVRDAYERLESALPAARLYYSLKANPHPRLVAELGGLGCGAEVSSAGELRAALAAGVSPERCLYTGPGKTRSEVEAAVRAGVAAFSVESLTDLDRLESAARAHYRTVDVLVRVNPDENVAGHGLAMTGTASQFGMDYGAIVEAAPRLAAPGHARVRGFHCYFGTNLDSTAALLDQFELAARVSAELAERLAIDLRLVDLGGGFAHPYCVEGAPTPLAGVRERLEEILDRWLPDWRRGRPAIAFESGRYLVGGCGTLLCRVQDVKTSKGQSFAVVDAGINHLGGMSGLRRLPRLRAAVVGGPDPTGAAPAGVHLVGPLCTPLDWLSRDLEVAGLAVGDVLRIPNVGAYGLTASLVAFLGRECPVEVVLDGPAVEHVSSLVITREPAALGIDASANRAGGPWKTPSSR